MKKSLLVLTLITLAILMATGQPNAWINEIHYDNDGADQDEAIEVAIENASSYTLGDFALHFYNGSDGAPYGMATLDQFTEGTTSNGFTIFYYAYSGIQNGPPDGMSLSYQSTLIPGQFLSYEGTIVGSSGPANTITSTDIGVSEPGAIGESLQLTGTDGTGYASFTWTGPVTSTFGNLNSNQTFAAGPDTDPPVWTADYPNTTDVVDTKVTVTFNTDETGTAYYVVVADGANPEPSSAEVKAGVDFGGVTVIANGSIAITNGNMEYLDIASGLSASTSYDIWVVAEDDEGTPNIQGTPVKLDVATLATRALEITGPVAPENYAVGDTINITWTSANMDQLYLAVYSYNDDEIFPVVTDEFDEPEAIPASLGAYDLWIPHDADLGDYDIMLYDARDTSFHVAEGPFTIEDNRALSFVEPQPNDIYYLGDTVVFEWTNTDIDSILLGSYIYEEDETVIFTIDMETGEFQPLAADRDTFTFVIPLETPVDSAGLLLFDYYDTSFYDGPVKVYLMDTIKPRITTTLPMAGATDVPLQAMFQISFTEQVFAGTGNVYVRESDGTLIESIDIGGLPIFYNTVFFSLSEPLESGVSYYIEIDPGFVIDRKDLPFTGISNDSEWSFKTVEDDLLFSEYIEGSSSNKALEIFNPTLSDINLDNYRIAQSSNGNGWQFYHYFPSGAEIAAGDVWVIITDQVDPALFNAANADEVLSFPSVVHHNGNDARGLERSLDNGNTWTLIDVIGVPDEDPGAGWDVAGVTAATAEHTLLRKAGITIGNTNWTASAGTNAENSEWKVFNQNFFTNLGRPTPDASDQAEFAFFELRDTLNNNLTLSSAIDSNAATIAVEILFGKDSELDSLVAVFKLSNGASANYNSGDTMDFTSPVVFTVIAEDGLITKDWTVTVTVSGTASSEADIVSFDIPGSVGDASIETGPLTVHLTMPYGTDLSALTPVIEVSAGATASPESGTVQDFTSPVVYTVTAQDGSTTNDWNVTIEWEAVMATNIYSIQYTGDASGDSPLVGEKVKISGIITALNVYQDQLKGYYIQEADTAWSGIYVFDEDRDLTDDPQLGDSITVVGTVEEYYDVTEIGYVEYYMLEKTGVTLPGPVEVATGEANQEKWESVFMRFVGAECTNNDLGFDEVEVNDGSGASRLDDRIYNYTASSDFTIGNTYHVIGVMYYSFGDFKLLPRSAADISDVTAIGIVSIGDGWRIYPNPANGQFNLEFTSELAGDLELQVANIAGQVVYLRSIDNVGGKRITIDLMDQPAGLYFVKLTNGSDSVVKKIILR